MKKYDVMCANAKFIEEVELYEGIAFENDEFPARYYSSCSKEQALAVLEHYEGSIWHELFGTTI